MSLADIEDMDLLSFRSLHDSCERLSVMRRSNTVFDVNAASQGVSKEINRYLRDLIEDVLPATDDPQQAVSGRAAFKRDFTKANKR